MDKNIISIITLAVVIAVLIFSIVIFTSGTAAANNAGDSVEDTITVYGQGKVFLEPDVAYLSLGVETKSKDPKDAQSENTDITKAVIAALNSTGVDEKDILTYDYDLYKENGSLYYKVRTRIKVTIEDVENAGEVIKAASDAGSNVFYGISFDVIDRQDAYDEAIEMALGRAEDKAYNIAGISGRKLEGVISVEEDASNTSSYWYSGLTNYAYSSSEYTDSGDSSILSGRIQISATVYVVYSLK